MISGKLPNDTVWWLSTDGLKIWIESRDLEVEKFKAKVYNIVHGRIFHAKKEVGELTKSRLDSRRGKDAWIIKIDAIIDIYPELLDEIKKKETDAKKKKIPKRKKVEYKKPPIQIPIENYQHKETNINIEPINVQKKENEISNVTDATNSKAIDTNVTNSNVTTNANVKKLDIKDLFDLRRPYVEWIKAEIDKSDKGKITIPVNELKVKMGDEYLNMHDMRIYFGLKKILSTIGITVELKSSKAESVIVLKKLI